MEFKEILNKRHSSRSFTEKKIDKKDLKEIALEAQKVPSWGNSQPWKAFIATGETLENIRKEYMERGEKGIKGNSDYIPTDTETWHEFLKKHMESFYKKILSLPDASMVGGQFQWELFKAPAVAYFAIPKRATRYSVLDLGTFVQTFILSATDKGIDSVHAYQLIKYPDILRKYMNIPEDFDIVTGVALGYENDHPVNKIKSERESIEEVLEIYE